MSRRTTMRLLGLVLALSINSVSVAGQTLPQVTASQEYVLGPHDQIRLWALGVEELSEKPLRVDPGGFLDLPMLGRVKAAGLSVEQLRADLLKRLSVQVREPQVSIDIVEFGSQPVSVIGAVGQPGVHQLQGTKTLAEVLSLAGGLGADAGSKVRVSRRVEWGPIPLPGAKGDASGEFSVAEVRLKDFLDASRPAENIVIRPHDVITVPRAEVVYIIGAVRKPGAFTLNERESVSVLQALALAEGLGATPAAKDSKVLRYGAKGGDREEIGVDLKKVLAGKAPNVDLQPNDILFVPDSTSKRVAARTLEAAVQTLSGLVIWRGF